MKMRTRMFLICASLLMVSSVGCVSDPKKAEKLSRSTASALINEAEQSGKRVVPDFTVQMTLPTKLGFITEAAYRSHGVTSAEQLANIRYNDQSNLNFYRSLVSKGWVKEVTACIPPGGPAFGEGMTWYCFSSANPEVVELVDPASINGVGHIFKIVAAKRSQMTVTGIVQEGSQAEAEVAVTISPTEMYTSSIQLVKAAESSYIEKYGAMQWRDWPKEADVNKSATIKCRFQKYDDGWRLVD